MCEDCAEWPTNTVSTELSRPNFKMSRSSRLLPIDLTWLSPPSPAPAVLLSLSTSFVVWASGMEWYGSVGLPSSLAVPSFPRSSMEASILS